MDVRCPQCGTDYVFDERRIGPKGVSVKCTACTHVFRVHRPDQEKLPWLILHPDGSQTKFQELTVLQRWIVEGRIRRSDRISRSGKNWKSLGEIGELEPFFFVYEQAEQLRQMLAAQGQPRNRVPTTDLVSAMDPLQESYFESSDSQSQISARPVQLTERRIARTTDPLVSPLAAPPAAEADDTKPMSLPGAAFASTSIDFQDEAPDVTRPASPPRPSPPVLTLALVTLALLVLVGVFLANWYPEPARRWLEGTGLPLTDSTAIDPPELTAPAAAETSTTAAPEPKPEAAPEPEPEVESDPVPLGPEEVSEPPQLKTPKSLLRAAAAHRASGRWTQALDTYGQVVDMQPTNAEAHTGKGQAYLALDRPRLALASFGRALDVNDAHAEAHFGTAEALLQLGKKQAARRAYQAYLSKAPGGTFEAQARRRLKRLK